MVVVAVAAVVSPVVAVVEVDFVAVEVAVEVFDLVPVTTPEAFSAKLPRLSVVPVVPLLDNELKSVVDTPPIDDAAETASFDNPVADDTLETTSPEVAPVVVPVVVVLPPIPVVVPVVVVLPPIPVTSPVTDSDVVVDLRGSSGTYCTLAPNLMLSTNET